MQAYEAGLKPGETRMVVSPNSEFFRYFNDPNGRRNGAAGNGVAQPAPAPAAPVQPAPAQ